MTKFDLHHDSITRSVRRGVFLLVAGFLLASAPLMAVDPVEIRSTDVVLKKDGLLNGTVLNSAAKPIGRVTVHVLHNERVVATATSNDKGEFSVTGLRNGPHVVMAGTTAQSVRLWSDTTAPPNAVEDFAIAVDEATVRGQMPGNQVGAFLASNSGALVVFGGAAAVTLVTTLGSDTKTDGGTPPVSSDHAFSNGRPASP